jgi:predicted Holliday junction resolvase-like endonuclease
VTHDQLVTVGGLALAALLVVLAFVLAFLRWKARYTTLIRDDAVRASRAVTTGKIVEQLVPHFPSFPFNPREARFVGSPVDFVVFDGLETGAVQRVVFVEVKTGDAGLTIRERLVRDAVRAGRVEWLEVRINGG